MFLHCISMRQELVLYVVVIDEEHWYLDHDLVFLRFGIGEFSSDKCFYHFAPHRIDQSDKRIKWMCKIFCEQTIDSLTFNKNSRWSLIFLSVSIISVLILNALSVFCIYEKLKLSTILCNSWIANILSVPSIRN